jgi:hypothetical protein
MSKNPGPDQKFRTQNQFTYAITYLMSKNPGPDQKFIKTQDQFRYVMLYVMSKNPGPYRKFRNPITQSDPCISTRA